MFTVFNNVNDKSYDFEDKRESYDFIYNVLAPSLLKNKEEGFTLKIMRAEEYKGRARLDYFEFE